MGYTTYQAVEGYLGITLTVGQRAVATGVIEAATTWIDRHTAQSWQAISPVADERCELLPQTGGGLRVYVKRRPVVAVTAVKTRSLLADATVTTLTSGDWELLDAAAGLLLIAGWTSGDAVALVSYTHSQTSAPNDVQLACQMIAGSWLTSALRPDSAGVQSISVGQNDLAVTYAANAHSVPAEALQILAQYRRVVIA